MKKIPLILILILTFSVEAPENLYLSYNLPQILTYNLEIGAQGIGGAIFQAKQDLSHPVNFSYKDDNIALFRDTTIFIEADSTSYKNFFQYTENPLLTGYISDPNLKLISNTSPLKRAEIGRGNVILFTDNTNFRAFWYDTNKLLMNAIFFGDEI